MDSGTAPGASSSLVHRMSLATFASFAESTAHESVVADSIGADELTRQTVVDFLSRVSDYSP